MIKKDMYFTTETYNFTSAWNEVSAELWQIVPAKYTTVNINKTNVLLPQAYVTLGDFGDLV